MGRGQLTGRTPLPKAIIFPFFLGGRHSSFMFIQLISARVSVHALTGERRETRVPASHKAVRRPASQLDISIDNKDYSVLVGLFLAIENTQFLSF